MKKANKTDSDILRQKAQELLNALTPSIVPSGTASPFSEIEILRIIQELEVHKIELELQNEELRNSWAIAKVANEKHIKLYDLAPSGNLTLSSIG